MQFEKFGTYAYTCETTITDKLVNMSSSIKISRRPFIIPLLPPCHIPNPKQPTRSVTVDESTFSRHFCK